MNNVKSESDHALLQLRRNHEEKMDFAKFFIQNSNFVKPRLCDKTSKKYFDMKHLCFLSLLIIAERFLAQDVLEDIWKHRQ